MYPRATNPEPSSFQHPVILLMGPTASGKTALAVSLAESLNGEVISVDSALVYRGMDIGTAKPDLEERRGIPHHLIDLIDPAERYSTGQFQKDALRLIEEIQQRGRLPILAGGTMLYFHGLIHGLSPLPPANPDIRKQIEHQAEKEGWPKLHATLSAIDPEAGQRIHPNDPQRIQRALEVFHITGLPLTTLLQNQPRTAFPYRAIPCLIAPRDRAQHADIIHQRFENMVDAGLVEEVKKLHDRGDLHPNLPSIRAVGYRQVWSYLESECNFETMIERATTATRQFAKRQMTWLRRESFALALESEAANLTTDATRQLQIHLDLHTASKTRLI